MSQLFENAVKQAVMQGSQYVHNSVGKFGSTYWDIDILVLIRR